MGRVLRLKGVFFMHALADKNTTFFGYSVLLASISLDRPSSARCANICMLMSFLIRQHPTRTKVLLSSSRLVEKICILLRNKEKHLRLSKFTSHVRFDLYTFVILKNGRLTSELFRLCSSGDKVFPDVSWPRG